MIKDEKIKALILRIEANEAYLYKLEEGKLEEIGEEKNNFIENIEIEKEYISVTNPRGINGLKFNVNLNKEAENRIKENRLFLEYMQEVAKKMISKEPDYNFLVVTYSDSFTDLIENFKVDGISIVLINKNWQDEELIREHVTQKLIEEQNKNNINLFKKIKEDYKNYIEGWDNIIKSADMGKIEILFVNKDRQDQNVFDPDWVMEEVTQTGGRIVLLKDTDGEELPQVAAQTRY